MIDYVTLMLINMVIALVALALFVWRWPEPENQGVWAPVFGACGLVATVCGFVMTFTWPLPDPYNIAYGEMSVLLGVLFLAAAWALTKNGSFTPLGVFAFFAGLMAVLVGVRFLDLGLTQSPNMSGMGFILTGAGGVLTAICLVQPRINGLRKITSLMLLAGAAVWLFTAGMAYWLHLAVKP